MDDSRVTLPVREPDEPPSVKVHWEWQQYALWISGRYGLLSIQGDEIGLSSELVRDLIVWTEVGDAGFNEDYPPDSIQPAGWAEDRLALATRVRAELPAEWIVMTRHPQTGKRIVLPPSGPQKHAQ